MAERRAACHLPERVHHRPKWQLVLDMLDELDRWDLRPPVLVTDAGYGEVGLLRQGLDDRQIPMWCRSRPTPRPTPSRSARPPRRTPAGATPRRQAAARADGLGWELPVRWLLVEWPQDKAEPVKYWLSNLPEATPIVELVRLARLRWRVEQDYRELKGALGLDHFEGRGWPGWHHHVTLVSVAHGFLVLERLRSPLVASA